MEIVEAVRNVAAEEFLPEVLGDADVVLGYLIELSKVEGREGTSTSSFPLMAGPVTSETS